MPPDPRATAEGIVEYVAGESGSVILEHERELWLDRIEAALDSRDREWAEAFDEWMARGDFEKFGRLVNARRQRPPEGGKNEG